MKSNGSTTVSLEGHIHTVFNEACDKLGVDSETLAMMAISGFLNSPLVSGGTETQTVQTMQRSQASDSDDGNEHLHTSSMSNGKDYFVNVSSFRLREVTQCGKLL